MNTDAIKAEYEEAEESRRKDEERARQYYNDLASVLGRPEGTRVFHRIIEKLGLFSSIFTGNSKTYYLAARMEAAQEIFTDMTVADPDGAVKVLMQGYNERAKREGK